MNNDIRAEIEYDNYTAGVPYDYEYDNDYEERCYCVSCGTEIKIDGIENYGDMCIPCLDSMYSDEKAIAYIEIDLIDEYRRYYDMMTDRDNDFWHNVVATVKGTELWRVEKNPTRRSGRIVNGRFEQENMLRAFCYEDVRDWYTYLREYYVGIPEESTVKPIVIGGEYDPYADMTKKGAGQ